MLQKQQTNIFDQVNPQTGSGNHSSQHSTALVLSGLARSNVEALIKAQASQADSTAVGNVVPALQDSEQQPLMLRCHLEKFHITLETSTLMWVEGQSVSWRSLIDTFPADVAQFFLVENIHCAICSV